jgi:hypothetical protein
LEEKIGYYYEIKEYRRLGEPVNINGMAVALSSHVNLDGQLISFDEASQWVADVIGGWWRPPLPW